MFIPMVSRRKSITTCPNRHILYHEQEVYGSSVSHFPTTRMQLASSMSTFGFRLVSLFNDISIIMDYLLRKLPL